MALPNNETLKDHRFRGAWRPSQEAERLWERNVDSFFTPSNGVRLHMKLFKNAKATDAVLIVQGFNETLHKYVEVVHELYSAGFSVALYDHRGQGLSDREPGHLSAAGHVIAFGDFVSDCAAVANHVRDVFGLANLSSTTSSGGSDSGSRRNNSSSSSKNHLHVVGHSMGGLITAHTVATHPPLFDGRLVLSAPAFEVVWGAPPGLPRFLASSLGRTGCALGLGKRLAPTPDGQLSWWDPHKAITGVRLTHHDEYLTWYWALRAQNPQVALSGPSMQWIREVAAACAAMPEVAPHVQNATLLFTAEHDDLVATSGHVTFCHRAPRCRRVLVQGAFHEIFFETPPVAAAACRLMLHWLTSSQATTSSNLGCLMDGLVPTIPATLLAAPSVANSNSGSNMHSSSLLASSATAATPRTAGVPICVCVQSSDGSGVTTPPKSKASALTITFTAASLAASAKSHAASALQMPAYKWGILTAAGGALFWVGYRQVFSFRRHRFEKQPPKDTNVAKALVAALANALLKPLKDKSTWP